MIIKITLEEKHFKNITLPSSYNSSMQGFIYSNLGKLSKFIHNVGFKDKKTFKLFTFSKLIGKCRKIITDKGNMLLFEPRIDFYFASPLNDIVESFANTLMRKGMLKLYHNTVIAKGIEPVELPIARTDILVKTQSPVVADSPDGKRRIYHTPFDDEFYRILKKNLLYKYEILYGEPYKGELEIEKVNVQQHHFKKIFFKTIIIKAWEGTYRIKGTADMVKLALEAGLGSKNSQGFGMVLPC